MEIILLKNHNGAKKGSKHDVSAEAANYLVRTKVAEYSDKPNLNFDPVIVNTEEGAKPKSKKQNKKVKPELEKK